MPDRLNLDSDRILAGVVAFGNLLDERAHLIRRHTLRLDPAHLAAMHSMMAFRLVDGGYGIFGIALTVSIAQIEMITVIKTIANGPMVIASTRSSSLSSSLNENTRSGCFIIFTFIHKILIADQN